MPLVSKPGAPRPKHHPGAIEPRRRAYTFENTIKGLPPAEIDSLIERIEQ